MSRLEELRSMPVEELRRRYADGCEELPRGGLTALREDPRSGARGVAERILKRIHAAQAEGRRLSRLCAFEQPLWDQGLTLVAGVDEVGMAPLAGPVIAAAVILRPGTRIQGVNDSKQLTRRSAMRWSPPSAPPAWRSGSAAPKWRRSIP